MFLENTVNHKEQFGWIEVICGSMFSGKTEELIRRLRRAQFARQKVEIFKPTIDVRYDDDKVVSHDSNEIRSTPVPAAANIPILADGCDVVGIDEAQFFDDEIVRVCNDLANKGVRVIVAGLDMDFKGNPFGPMPYLMATAEYVTKVHAICTRTGNLAQYSYRKTRSEELVLLGEVDEYEPLSRAAYYKSMQRDKLRNLKVNDPEEVSSKQKTTMAKAEETVLEIDLKALTHNFNYLKSKLRPETKFLAVVKAFAYGSDAIEVGKYLENIGADYLAVAYAKEGVALRDSGVSLPILVLHPQPVNFKTLIDRCLEPSLYSMNVLNEFITIAEKGGQRQYPVHIKFNTGLNRLGFDFSDVGAITMQLKKTDAIKAKSLFSHMAASEDLDEIAFTKQQIVRFKNITKEITSQIGYQPWLHMCNTSGVLNFPEAHFDMVRCGIGLYGFGNSPIEDKNFIPIASLKSIISQIHTVKKGDSVGYNRAFTAKEMTKTATIPIGHADGLNRNYGKGNGYVSINKQKAPIIGNVCMDMIMVNVTNIECTEGEEVIIFDARHTANDLAKSANTISYEILTSISQRVKRVYLK